MFEKYLNKYSADRNYYEMMMSTMKVEHSIFRHDFMMNPTQEKVTNFDGIFNVLKPLSASEMKKKSSIRLDGSLKKPKYEA